MIKNLLFPWRKEEADELGRVYPRLILRTGTVLFDMVIINLILSPFTAFAQKFFIDHNLIYAFQQRVGAKLQNAEAESLDLVSYLEWKKLLLDSGLLKQYINYNLFISAAIWLIVVACWSKFGTTPAKWLMNLKIVDFKTGKRPTKKQFLIRGLVVAISIVPLGLGYVWMMFDKYNRTWHDLASGTVVIKSKRLRASSVKVKD